MAITVPEPSTYPAGPSGYTAPTALSLPSFSGTYESATEVGAFTNQVRENETLVAFGKNLDSLADFVIWAGRPTVAVSIDGQVASLAYTALPASPPWRGVIWVWPRDGDSAFGPAFRLNGPELLRCDTRELFDGDTSRQIRIAGKNVAVPGFTPVVVVEHSGGTDTSLTVTAIGDYELVCDIPDSLATGTYTIHVHNGTGGAYGWGGWPGNQTLTVSAAPTALGSDITVSAANQTALNTALLAVTSAGARVILPAGTITVTGALIDPAGPVQFVGQGAETWNASTSSFSSTGGSVVNFALADVGDDVGFLLTDDRCGLSDLSARLSAVNGSNPGYLVAIGGKHVTLDNCVLVSDYTDAASAVIWAGNATAVTDTAATHKDMDCEVKNCTVYANFWGVNHAQKARYFRFNNNTFYMGYDGALGTGSGNCIDDFGSRYSYYRDNTFRGLDKANDLVMNRGIMWHTCRNKFNTALRNDFLAGGLTDALANGAEDMNENESEQIIFHQANESHEVLTVGTVSGTSVPVTTTPATGNLSGDDAEEFVIVVLNGVGRGQWRKVTALTSSTYTIDSAFRIDPASGDKVIVFRAFVGLMLAHNRIDPTDEGTHANEVQHQIPGIAMYNSCVECYAKENRIENVSYGTYIIGSDGVAGNTGPSLFNEVRGNRYDSLYEWNGGTEREGAGTGPQGGEPSPAMSVAMSSSNQSQVENVTYFGALGNAYRDNRVYTMADTWVYQHGFRRKTSAFTYSPGFVKGGDKGMFGNVFEGAVLSGCDTLITIAPPSNYAVVRNNRFDGSANADESIDATNQTANDIDAVTSLSEDAGDGTLFVGPAVTGALEVGPAVSGVLSVGPAVGGLLEVN